MSKRGKGRKTERSKSDLERETAAEFAARWRERGIGLPDAKLQRINANYDEFAAFALRKASLGFTCEVMPQKMKQLGLTLWEVFDLLELHLPPEANSDSEIQGFFYNLKELKKNMAAAPSPTTELEREAAAALEQQVEKLFNRLVVRIFRGKPEEELFLFVTRKEHNFGTEYSNAQICHWMWVCMEFPNPSEDQIIEMLNEAEFILDVAVHSHVPTGSKDEIEASKLFALTLRDALLIMQRRMQLDRFGLSRLSGPAQLRHLSEETEAAIQRIENSLSETKTTWSDIAATHLGVDPRSSKLLKGLSQLRPLVDTPPIYELWKQKQLLSAIRLKEKETAEVKEELPRAAAVAGARASARAAMRAAFEKLKQAYKDDPKQLEAISRDERKALDDLMES